MSGKRFLNPAINYSQKTSKLLSSHLPLSTLSSSRNSMKASSNFRGIDCRSFHKGWWPSKVVPSPPFLRLTLTLAVKTSSMSPLITRHAATSPAWLSTIPNSAPQESISSEGIWLSTWTRWQPGLIRGGDWAGKWWNLQRSTWLDYRNPWMGR